MRAKQTGRSCRAWRADPCIMLAVFLPPAVGPGDLEELSHGGFHETAEVSLILSHCILLTSVLSDMPFQEPLYVSLRRVSPITGVLKPSSTSCQEVWSLCLLCRLGSTASAVLQCPTSAPCSSLGRAQTFQLGLCFGMASCFLDGSSPRFPRLLVLISVLPVEALCCKFTCFAQGCQ